MDNITLHYHKKKRKFATDGLLVDGMQKDVETWELSGEDSQEMLFTIFKQATGLDVDFPQLYNKGKFIRLGPRGLCYIAVFNNITQQDHFAEGANFVRAMNTLIVDLDK